MTQGQTKENDNKKRKLTKSPGTSSKGETRSRKKQEMKKSISSRGQTVQECRRKSMVESQDKETEKEQEAEKEKEEDIMPPPKPRVK